MKVPTYVKYLKNKLLVNSNNKISYITPPFKPYTFVPSLDSNKHIITLSNMKPVPVVKKEYDSITDYFLESKTELYSIDPIDQILIELPEFFDIENEDFVVMILDIEVETFPNEPFPKPEKNKIIAIGCSFLFNCEDKEKLETKRFILVDKENELRVLKAFMQLVLKFSPDIICGYNVKFFDLAFIAERLNKHHMKLEFLSKTNYTKIFGKFQKQIIISGVTVFDILESVKGDFALRGIKNKSMKTVAKHFNIEGIVDLGDNIMSNLNAIEPALLYSYLRSDIMITERLFMHYFPIKKALAEVMHLPLNLAIEKPPGYLPTILQARVLRANSIIGDLPNSAKYKELNYTGGDVWFNNKPGLYENICKVDFVSMYPNIIMQFNLSPDTVRFIKEEPLSTFLMEDLEDRTIIHLPEHKLKKNIVISVLKKEGLISAELKRIFNLRKIYKDEYKNASEKDKPTLYSKQYALKVLLNSVYGYNAAAECLWGDFYVGLAITSIGRQLVKTIADFHKDKVIEVDTDGVFYSTILDEKVLINLLATKFGKQFELDRDDFDSAYFYLAKNYILFTKGKMTIKGNSLKSSRTCPLIDKARDMIIKRFLVEKAIKSHEDRISLSKELSSLLNNSPLSDFLFSTKAERLVDDYKGNCIQKKILTHYTKLGRIVNRGEAMYFAISINNKNSKAKKQDSFIVKEQLTSKSQLDLNYYKQALESLLEIFSLSNLTQRSLTDFMNTNRVEV